MVWLPKLLLTKVLELTSVFWVWLIRVSEGEPVGVTTMRFEELALELLFTFTLALALAAAEDWRPLAVTLELLFAVAEAVALVSAAVGKDETKLSYQLFTKL